MGKRLSGDEKVGCAALALVLLINAAWIGFVVWAIYSIVSWLVTK